MLTASIFEICDDSSFFQFICDIYRLYVIDTIHFERMLKARYSLCLQ